MIIINTTFVTDLSVRDEVLEWIRNTYILSAVHRHAIQSRTILTKILGGTEADTESYALHLWFETIELATDWDNRLGVRLRAKLNERWRDKAMAFHTYMEVTE